MRRLEALQVALDAAFEDGGELPLALRRHLAALPTLKLVCAVLDSLLVSTREEVIYQSFTGQLGYVVRVSNDAVRHDARRAAGALQRAHVWIARRLPRWGPVVNTRLPGYGAEFDTWREAHDWLTAELEQEGYAVGVAPETLRHMEALDDAERGES